ncbi:MAG: tail fiber protein [Rhizobiales bacterium]|nr:tail fiber protein [Hyphomicrobiales bacterium]
MPEAYVGEIRLFAGAFAPAGWLPCDGRLMRVADHEVLYTLIGNSWGGDHIQFKLPDLSGRVAIGAGATAGGSTRVVGQLGGAEAVVADLPVHTHHFLASAQPATALAPAGQMLATVTPSGTTAGLYLKVAGTEQVMADGAIVEAGGGSPHANTMPSVGLGYIICTVGEFPVQN